MDAITFIFLAIALGFMIPHIIEILRFSTKNHIIIHRDTEKKYPYYFTPQMPVHWFDFQGLINTFRRVSLSSDILSIIDKREVQANFGQDKKDELFDNRKNKDAFWLDFIADTGDGFDATTTVFYHLTRQNWGNQLGTELEQGDALVIGGDLVYPDGSDINYTNRFKGPIRFVFPSNTNNTRQPYLLAVPGNHDWYDGLTAFYRMMAQQDQIGNYKTIQNRSYFAYHLGFNHHILGLDNQLKGDLDLPQVDYFKRYFEKICKPGLHLHLIILVAEPYWYSFESNDYKKRRQRMDSLDYFVKIIKKKAQEKAYLHRCEIHVDVVITGDMHHYSHYELEKENPNQVKHYITSGGGGAFGHVTGFLKNKLLLPELGKSKVEFDAYHLKQCYPTKKDSEQFIGFNLGFFIRNYKFTSLILMISLFSICLYDFVDHIVLKILCQIIVPLVLVGTVKQVANPEPSQKETNHNKILYIGLWLICISIAFVFKIEKGNFNSYVQYWVATSILQAFFMGIYFYLAYQIFGLHITEISSGKIQEGRKNFLKFKITKNEVVIYVLGIKEKYSWLDAIKKHGASKLQEEMNTTHQSHGQNTEDEFLKKYFNNSSDNIELIETIKIKHHENE